MKTLRSHLFLWGVALALVPTFFFVVWFNLFGMDTQGGAGSVPAMITLVAVILTMVVVLLMLVYWGYRWIVTPVRQLNEAAKAIQEGNFDYQMEAGLVFKGPLEMRELCYTFARMAERINSQIRFLEKANETLARKEERWQLALQGKIKMGFGTGI